MLLLAGFLGLITVGGVALAADFSDDSFEEDQDDNQPDTELPPVAQIDQDSVTGNQILTGGEADDLISGAAGDDQINGYQGNDQITGGDGDDHLNGDFGKDMLWGGNDDDTLHGEDGQDILNGGMGNDLLYGHNDDDLLHGEEGNDDLFAGDGDDLLYGGAGDDALHGGMGNDTLNGGAGQDTLFGGPGNDTISGVEPPGEESAQADFLNGGEGEDTIFAGAADVVTAGDGADTIIIDKIPDEGNAVHLMDFDKQEDQLLVICDLMDNPSPTIEMIADENTAGVNRIFMDGHEIARVEGGDQISPDDIVLIDRNDSAVVHLPAA